ncbi:T-cell immunoglobulin and mucin domain-containing protein 4 [Lates calcarifer]|uniref:T-cell immunoglobulin and mucin domain-containing protein 4 n=1 Tax=Lates calcarifer TaxID=8187 RepID=UPI0008742745|nr:T-cell immunoglobulin and mucin domain-containing protein 4 [Lates calcarifer]
MKTMNRLKLMLLLVLPSVSEHDSSRVVGRTGQDVTLPCRYEVKKHGLQSVCWNRGDLPLQECNNRLIATSKLRVKEETRVSSRYQLQGRLDEGDVSLTILNLTESDAGRYGCRVRVRGPFNDLKYHIDLNIEKAPITTTIAGRRGSDITTWKGSDITTWKGSDVTTWRGNDVTPTEPMVTLVQEMWSTAVQQQQVNSLQTFVGNTVRLSFIIFIPALLLTAAYRVWRTNQKPETDRRLNQSEEEEEEAVTCV